MNTKFNPETDIIFSIDEKIRRKKENTAAPVAVKEVTVATNIINNTEKKLPTLQLNAPQNPSTPPELPMPPKQSVSSNGNTSLIFFEFQIPIFAQWCQQNANGLRRSYQLVSDLAVLTSELKRKVPLALFLPFSVAPKAMEQLVGQISSKFHHVKIVLISLEAWTPDKIKELQSKYQISGKQLHFVVWPMGILAIEEILSQ